ncbi:PDZ domain-containing protein [Bacillus taeanensis]|uniref:PDZ domain-containing protein n=1 Tax=Bacillus taeanensis TaxID=273032 RepID=A0A366XXQ6_9BACI|nr:PDZ domain-containing protein [Bacillus taeanensis]RBW71180.1 PDZ domain-containing protein [Bacillus taeanensis]
MVESLLIAFVKGFIALFFHPLFYGFLILSFFLGLKRVKKERAVFNVRVFDRHFELLYAILPGFAAGMLVSLLFLILGFFMSNSFLMLLSICAFLLSLSLQIQAVSPSLVIAFTMIAGYVLEMVNPSNGFLKKLTSGFQETSAESVFFLLSVLILAEGLLIYFQAKKRTSPRLLKGKRGKLIGAHDVSRLWLLPIFFLVPGTAVERLNWWPLFTEVGSVSMLCIPFAIGFKQIVRHTVPERAVKEMGKKVITLGTVAFLTAVVITFFINSSIFAMVGLWLTIAIRIFIGLKWRLKDRDAPAYFTNRNNGLMILGILPYTPAANMNLKIGEIIHKVNGQRVKSPEEFYQSLQLNGAFCKLEVLDEQGEIRFENRSLFDNEHHELGLLFVSEDLKNGKRVG